MAYIAFRAFVTPMTPLDTAHAFLAAINAADTTAMRALMTDDHTFTLGHSFSGAETMLSGWQHFFHVYPGYRITIDRTFADADRVALFGKAEGGWRVNDVVIPQRRSVPAAWRAEVHSGKVRRWTVFCDTAWATPPKP
jgi:ketosteroid isomerase-like protein